MLDKLPVEILRMVVGEMEQTRDVVNLSRVSRGLHQSTLAMLLERPVFRAPEEFVSCVEAPSSMEDYFKDDWYSGQPERLIMISDLKIVAPVISRRRGRCYEQVFVHYGYPNDEETIRTNGIRHDEIMKNLTPSVIEIFSRIPRDYLRSFTWGLCCCIPSEVIGAHGYISKNQTCIQSLSLMTDGTCLNILRDYSGLLELKQLRHLSWKGIDSGSKARILRQLLEANHEHLETLDLETFPEDHPRLHLYDITGDPIVTEDATRFPALRHLTLSGISLSGSYTRMNLSFSLEELQSLRIRSCLDGLNLLFAMARARKAIKLRCLEVVYTEQSGDEVFNRVHPINKFLKSFKGLEELYISLRDWTPPFRDLHQSILHHKETLKRLVHHEREWDLNPNSERKEYICDRKTPWFRSIDDIVGRMWLECIGVTIPPLYLKEKLETSVRLTDFKLLHFRITARHYGARDLLGELKAAGYSPDDGVITSGNSTERLRQTTPNGGPISTSLDCKEFICMKDLLQFVQWAFGPKEFGELSAIAYGDFSHNTRFKWSQFLFCRADPTSVDESLIAAGVQPATFRIMTRADEGLLDQIKGSREFLSACPVEAILDLYDDGYGTQESWFDPYTDGFRPYVPGVTGVGVEGFDDEDDHVDSVDSLEA